MHLERQTCSTSSNPNCQGVFPRLGKSIFLLCNRSQRAPLSLHRGWSANASSPLIHQYSWHSSTEKGLTARRRQGLRLHMMHYFGKGSSQPSLHSHTLAIFQHSIFWFHWFFRVSFPKNQYESSVWTGIWQNPPKAKPEAKLELQNTQITWWGFKKHIGFFKKPASSQTAILSYKYQEHLNRLQTWRGWQWKVNKLNPELP